MKVLRICTKGKVINPMIELEEEKNISIIVQVFLLTPLSKKVKEALEESVLSGVIDIGENIVQREYIRTVFDKTTGQLVEKTVYVFGRKHSLRKIRIKLFEKYKKFMRLNSNSYFEHNVCFQHFVLLKNMIKFEKLKMTRDKIYGKYLHNLLVHAPLQYRLVSGESINCEDEERFFKTIRDMVLRITVRAI